MFLRLLLLFIGVPVLELCIFMALGNRIGIPTTLAIIVITAVLGAYLTKSQGTQGTAQVSGSDFVRKAAP
jgi:UPF0716 protein FxsA